MTKRGVFFTAAIVFAFTNPGALMAQNSGGVSETTAKPTAASNSPAPAPWASQCSAQGRADKMNCHIEQRVVLSTTNQLLLATTVSLPADATNPVMMIQTPLSLHLPAGLKMAVDGATFDTLALQTCDPSGCYAGTPVSAELLAAMQRGNALTVTFQDLQKKDISVPVSLHGFSAAFTRIR